MAELAVLGGAGYRAWEKQEASASQEAHPLRAGQTRGFEMKGMAYALEKWDRYEWSPIVKVGEVPVEDWMPYLYELEKSLSRPCHSRKWLLVPPLTKIRHRRRTHQSSEPLGHDAERAIWQQSVPLGDWPERTARRQGRA